MRGRMDAGRRWLAYVRIHPFLGEGFRNSMISLSTGMWLKHI